MYGHALRRCSRFLVANKRCQQVLSELLQCFSAQAKVMVLSMLAHLHQTGVHQLAQVV